MPAGEFVHSHREFAALVEVSEAPGDEGLDFADRERSEPVQLARGRLTSSRCAAVASSGCPVDGRDVTTSISLCWFSALRQALQQADARRIAAMQILEDQDERNIAGDRLDRLGELPLHARCGGAEDLAHQVQRVRRR